MHTWYDDLQCSYADKWTEHNYHQLGWWLWMQNGSLQLSSLMSQESKPASTSQIYSISSPIILCWISFLEFVVLGGLQNIVRIVCRTTGPKILCSVQKEHFTSIRRELASLWFCLIMCSWFHFAVAGTWLHLDTTTYFILSFKTCYISLIMLMYHEL